MPTVALTQRATDALKAPAKGRIEYFDRTLPGFGLRITDAGRKTWFVMYRVGGKKVRETIGTVAKLPNVGDARERARESIKLAQSGVHPVAAREEAAAIAAAKALTFGAVADRYLTEHAERNTRPATIREYRRILKREAAPKWGERPVREITRRDVDELLDQIADRGALVLANRALARLKTLFSWAYDKELIDENPTARVRRRVKETPRDRALTDDEIRHFWLGCDRLGWPFGPLLKLLLLTAQRKQEVGGMGWREIDFDKRQWTIPRERAKNDRAHEVHLSDLAVEIIEALPRLSAADKDGAGEGGSVDLVFTMTGKTRVSGYGHAKNRLDRFMFEMVQAEMRAVGKDAEKASIGEWILHDLRRTAATGMARMNIAPHVVDRILNHVSGTIRGVAAVYNRHAYIEERRAALEAWSRYVESLVRSRTENIVQLAHRR